MYMENVLEEHNTTSNLMLEILAITVLENSSDKYYVMSTDHSEQRKIQKIELSILMKRSNNQETLFIDV